MIREAREPYTREYREDMPMNQENSTEQATRAPAERRAVRRRTFFYRRRGGGVPMRYTASTSSSTQKNSSR